jgi:hypothetical protein
MTNLSVNYFSTKETLERIGFWISTNKPGIYMRLGDGDINLALGRGELFQQANPFLSQLMKDAIQLEEDGIFKALPLHCLELGTLEEGMFPGNHECQFDWCQNIINSFHQIAESEDRLEFYSAVALCHQAVVDPEYAASFLKEMGSKVKYFIGNENIPREVLERVFNEKVIHIPTPSSNSFSQFDKIFSQFINAVKSDDEYSVVVTSMGCSGRPMQKRIYDNYENFFLFDFGSLMDALCGDATRAWIELTNFDKDGFLERLVV